MFSHSFYDPQSQGWSLVRSTLHCTHNFSGLQGNYRTTVPFWNDHRSESYSILLLG